MGLRSGLLAGQSMQSMPCLLNQKEVVPAVCGDALSCWYYGGKK
jgi:hypothetical protein